MIYQTDYKLIISGPDSKLVLELLSVIWDKFILDSSLLDLSNPSEYKLLEMEEGNWKVIKEGTFLQWLSAVLYDLSYAQKSFIHFVNIKSNPR